MCPFLIWVRTASLGVALWGEISVPSTRHGNEDPLSPAPLLRTWKEKTLVELTAFEAEEEAGGPASYCAPPPNS